MGGMSRLPGPSARQGRYRTRSPEREDRRHRGGRSSSVAFSWLFILIEVGSADQLHPAPLGMKLSRLELFPAPPLQKFGLQATGAQAAPRFPRATFCRYTLLSAPAMNSSPWPPLS